MVTSPQRWTPLTASDMATYPGIDNVVLAKLQHCSSKATVETLLVHVKEDDVTWRAADDLSEISYDWDVVAWRDARLANAVLAPLTEGRRRALQRGIGPDRTRFELGCWLHFYQRYIRRAGATQARIDCARRIFLAGYARLDDSFLGTFAFGEREFDSLFEAGDADTVVSALRQLIATDATGNIAKAFAHLGWPINLD